MTINVQDRVPRRQEKYIIEDSTEGCNLTVKNVEVKDEGGFFCRIFIGKTTIESTGYLTVTSKLFAFTDYLKVVNTLKAKHILLRRLSQN